MERAMALPEEERLELIEALIASLHADGQPPFDESWREVIQRRSEELAAGAVKPVPWSEVKQRARSRISNCSPS
jgi:putative addiction module component (TIGR02574 family)